MYMYKPTHTVEIYSITISTYKHNHPLTLAKKDFITHTHTHTLGGLPSVLTSQAVLAAPQAWDAINDSLTHTHIHTGQQTERS